MTREQLDELKGHTPGPWVYVETLSSCYVKAGHYTERGKEIVNYSYSLSPTIDSANAKLIAAAPDLLAHIDEQQSEIEMLQGSLEEWRLDFAGLKEDNARLRRAIKKHKDEMRRYLPILEALEAKPSSWEWFTDGTGIATLNGYREALKEVGDERV